MRRILAAIFTLMLCVPARADYDVNIPHVIINQIYGASNGGYISHSFIELYNPTSEKVNLDGWAVHYRSSPEGPDSRDWVMTELSGDIPSHHSYLLRGAADTKYSGTDRTVSQYDKLLTEGGGQYTQKA